MEKLSGILKSKHERFFIIITETFIGEKNTAGQEIFHQRHSYIEWPAIFFCKRFKKKNTANNGLLSWWSVGQKEGWGGAASVAGQANTVHITQDSTFWEHVSFWRHCHIQMNIPIYLMLPIPNQNLNSQVWIWKHFGCLDIQFSSL